LRSNILDILAETTTSCRSWLALAATLGIRNTWFFQTIHANYEGGSFNAGTDTVSMRSHFYGIGPRLGLPLGLVPMRIFLLCRGAAACFYGFFHIKEEESFTLGETASIHRSLTVFVGMAMRLQAFCGNIYSQAVVYG